jgi:hypothetical protein
MYSLNKVTQQWDHYRREREATELSDNGCVYA